MTRTLRLCTAALAAAFWLATSAAWADVKPHGLISEGMVLQQKTKVRIWGTGDPGEKVTVSFRGEEAATAVGQDRNWSVQLASKEAGGPFPLTIQGKNTIAFKNVLVGEVWVCSGQSNMQWAISQCDKTDQTAATGAPANPMLRMFTVPRVPRDTPIADITGSWVDAGPKTVSGMSAVGYFFGRDLQEKLKVPVGLISSNVGGTRAEAWTSRPVLSASPLYKGMVDAHVAAMQKNDKGKSPLNQNSVSALYNGMIAPLVNYSIKGAIWYQGESNAGQAYNYRTLFPMMIQNWRKDWGGEDFPFYFVQLAPFRAVKKEPGESNWAELCEAQRLTAKNLANTGMAVITDFGHEGDIHPTPKRPVGERLALIARAKTYGEKVEYSGPDFASMRVDGNKAVLKFTHAEGLHAVELVATDLRKNGAGYRVKPGSAGAAVTGFTVAGADRKFHNAQAKIEGDSVIVWAEGVSTPVAVRYGWADHPLCNLYNKAGLPASPFRTDDFPVTTQPKQ